MSHPTRCLVALIALAGLACSATAQTRAKSPGISPTRWTRP